MAGLYWADVPALGSSGFEAGENYALVYTWTVSDSASAEVHTFSVN